jgi:subtilase family serine protease
MFRQHALPAMLAFLCTISSGQASLAADVVVADSAKTNAAEQPSNFLPAAPQITQAIDSNHRVAMSNNVRPEATAANDAGRVADSLPLENILLLLHRPDAQEQALDQFMADQLAPESPNYHQWLSAEQVGEYGPAQADLDTITSWLQSQGFTINQVHADGITIDFSGTAGQVTQAFTTEIHDLDVNGVAHFANMSVPEIPAALAPAVVGIVSLNDFRPHANVKPRPEYTVSSSTHAVVPADLATIYNLDPLFNGSPKIDGTGQTIVLLEEEDPYHTVGGVNADINKFRSTFGLPAFGGSGPAYSEVHPGGCTDPGDRNDGTDGEVELDIEWAGAAAPGATLHMASCADTTTVGVLLAAQKLNSANDAAKLWSISYGLCEAANGATLNAAFVSTYQTAAARGVSVFVSSGDEGASSCDANQSAATHGIAVSGWASTPYNVAVGGTDFGDSFAGTTSTYWNSTNTSTDGSARSYINEIPWNDSCASVLISSFFGGTSTPYGTAGFCNSSEGETDFLSTGSGSGGPSNCFSGSAATGSGSGGSCAGQAKPTWQAGFLGNPVDGVRDIPDVSLFAANGVWGHYFVYCFSNTADGGSACSGAPSSWSGAGGTSFSSPIMAGIQALVNQGANSSQGNPNPTYYALAKTEYGASGNANCNSTLGNAVGSSCIFYDVTQGDMDVNCTGTHNCYRPSGTNGVLSTSNSAYQKAYGTGTGWDFATGIGTVNATNLVNNWPGVAPAKLAFTTEPNASYASAATITVKVSVENSSGAVTAFDTSAVTLALSGGTAGATLSGVKTVNAVAGVATFTGLSVDKAGMGYKLTATDGSLTAAGSTTFNITSGAAKTVTLTTQPATNSNVTEGVAIPLVAHVVDAAGNAVSGQSVTLAIGNNAGSSTLAVATNPLTTDASGNATYANVSLNKVGSGYTLKATDTTTPAATVATSNTFNIVAGAAKTVTFSTQPAANASIAAGTTIPLVAHVVDAGGNAVSAQSITLAIGTNAGSSALSVTANPVASDASGNATFANVSLNKVGSAYTLKATDTTTPAAAVATSNAFNIVAGVAKTVTFGTQPGANVSIVAGATIPLVAHVADAGGNAVSAQNITLAIGANAGSSTLSVTSNPVASDSNGDATFASVSLNKSGSGYTFKATDSSTPAATTAMSNAFNIVAGAAAAVAFTTQPVTGSNVAPGATIPLVAHVVDSQGNAVSGDSITLAIGNNADGSTLSISANPVPTNVGGNATFANVSLDVAGTGYTFTASDTSTPAATLATSNAFNILDGPRLAFVVQPVDVTQGSLESVQVAIEDAGSNVMTSDNTTVINLTAPACGNPVILGTATVVNGVASFDNTLYSVASALNLTAMDATDAGAVSTAFNVIGNADFVFADGFDGCRP